jgi:hypothetical protein
MLNITPFLRMKYATPSPLITAHFVGGLNKKRCKKLDQIALEVCKTLGKIDEIMDNIGQILDNSKTEVTTLFSIYNRITFYSSRLLLASSNSVCLFSSAAFFAISVCLTYSFRRYSAAFNLARLKHNMTNAYFVHIYRTTNRPNKDELIRFYQKNINK